VTENKFLKEDMMKTLKGVLCVMLILLAIISCDKTEKIVYESEQYVSCHIVDDAYYDKINSWGIYGTLTACPMPEFEFFKVNGEYYYEDYTEFLGIGFFDIRSPEMYNPIDEVINFEIHTSYGIMNCIIHKPASIGDIRINGQDTLFIRILRGEELRATWVYGFEKPDFIWINGSYDKYDGKSKEMVQFNKAIPNITSSTVLFETDEIDKLGFIDFYVIPTNGPLIGSDQEGNFIGDGCGYMWWFNDNPALLFEVQVVDSLGVKK